MNDKKEPQMGGNLQEVKAGTELSLPENKTAGDGPSVGDINPGMTEKRRRFHQSERKERKVRGSFWRVVHILFGSGASNVPSEKIVEPNYYDSVIAGESVADEVLRSSLRPMRPFLWLSIAMGFVGLIQSFYSLSVYDRVIPNFANATLYSLTMVAVFAVIIDLYFRHRRAKVVTNISSAFDAQMNINVLAKYMSLPLRTWESRRREEWMDYYMHIDRIRAFIGGSFVMGVMELPFVIFGFWFLWTYAAPAIGVVSVIVGLVLLLTLFSSRASKETGEQERKVSFLVNRKRSEMSASQMPLKNFSHDKLFMNGYAEVYQDWAEKGHQRAQSGGLYRELGQTVAQFQSIAVTGVCAVAAMAGEMSMGLIIAASMITARITAPLLKITTSWSQVSGAIVSLERLNQFFDLDEEIPDATHAVTQVDGSIVGRNVTYAIPGSETVVLDDASFFFKSGCVHALIGASGSGKSTFMKLLRGLHQPDSGAICVDDKYLLNNYGRNQIARWMGYMPQVIETFPTSILGNLLYANPALTEDGVRSLFEYCGLGYLYSRKDGIDREISNTASLSGGERRKLGLAQVLSQNPRILLLDEPTNDLDPEFRLSLINKIGEMKGMKTVIIATHELAALEKADYVHRLQNGKIITKTLAEYKAELMEFRDAKKREAAARAARAATTPGMYGISGTTKRDEGNNE